MKTYDILILGGGPGGYVAAIKAAKLGAETALIEKEALGGVCLNYGCIPTKALLKNAKVYQYVKKASYYGIDLEIGKISINWPNMLKRKDQAVTQLTHGVGMLLKQNGVDVYNGYGTVIDKNTVEVNHERIGTKNLIIAAGASPFIPPIEGLNEAMENGFALTSKELLSVDKIPGKLAIIGGGVIGVEFATLFASLGTDVTIIEKASDILLNLDQDLRAAAKRVLVGLNVKLMTSASVTKISKTSVTADEKEILTDRVLVSIGMRPNIQGLEPLGLHIEKGAVVTNDRMETNIQGVYAVGDVNGKYMLAHVASAEGITAVENIMGIHSKMNYDRIPAGIYTFPEMATAGLTEEEARTRGFDIKVSNFPLGANGRALAEGEKEGFIKLITESKYGEILGVHIMAPNATDMIAELVVAMNLEATADDLAFAIHPHPTFSEIIGEAGHEATGGAIHFYKKP